MEQFILQTCILGNNYPADNICQHFYYTFDFPCADTFFDGCLPAMVGARTGPIGTACVLFEDWAGIVAGRTIKGMLCTGAVSALSASIALVDGCETFETAFTGGAATSPTCKMVVPGGTYWVMEGLKGLGRTGPSSRFFLL